MCRVALICAKPRPTDAIERGCVEKAPTATGESQDGVREKGRSSTWGQGDTRGNRDGGMRIDCEGDCRRKVLWEVDAVRPGSVVVDLGSRVERGANGPRRLYRRPARMNGEPTSRPLHDRAAGMRNQTKRREHSDRMRPSFRFGVRRARLNPWTASRSGKALFPVGPTVRRAALDPRRSFPGKG